MDTDTATAARHSLVGLAAVVIVVLIAVGQPVIAGAVLLVVAVLFATTGGINRPTPPRRVERFCVSGGCQAPLPTEALLMTHRTAPTPAPVVPAPAPVVHVVHVERRAKRRRKSRPRDDDDDDRREGFNHTEQMQMRSEEEDDAAGWVRGMAPQRPVARSRPHPSHARNPKSMVNADTDGNPATCGLVIRDHFRPGGDQAMVLKPRFGGWTDPGLGADTSTPRKAMEAQRQTFQRNLLGYRNALLWPMYQSTEYQLRGINGRANVYDCGGSSYTGAPGVPIFNG